MVDFQNHLDHAKAAYVFSVRALPNPAELSKGPITLNGTLFKKESQIESMRIELGWAFFCSYESCLEAHLKRNGIPLSKKLSLSDWLKSKNVEIPENMKFGLEHYRIIRNSLHHEEGASHDSLGDEEYHLLPNHMKKFYELSLWCGQQVDNCRVKSTDGDSGPV